jgi:pimeloyl-ACP methyl ester carboxylesterase
MSKLRLIPSLAFGLMLTSAANPPAPAAAPLAAKCVRGWSGSLQFTRKQSSSVSKSVPRIAGKGIQTSESKMNYDYSAQITVRETPERKGFSIAKARATSVLTFSESRTSTDQAVCSGERQPRTMSGSFTTQRETRASTPGVDANVSVTMSSNGAYSIGISVPSLHSTNTGSSSSSYSGQCYPKKGGGSTVPVSEGRTDPVSFSTDGSHRAPLSDLNHLSGSYSKKYGNVTDTLGWDLRRCGTPLRLVDLKFEDMKFPLWEAWREVTPETSTVDGNIVRMKAIVANDSGEDQSAALMFKDGDSRLSNMPEGPPELLKQVSFSVAAGEEKTVEFLWDTSGYAWFDNGQARSFQKIKAEIWDNNKKIDDVTRNLRVAPRPLVLVHGYWADWSMWVRWPSMLHNRHGDWKAFAVGERPGNGKMDMGESATSLKPTNTISQNAAELARYIRYAQEFSNAWHVDIVGHTMGGLVARQYIHQSMPIYPDGKPQVAYLMMLGTPNLGSPCADVMSAPLEAVGKRVEVLREMRTSVVAQFNKQVFERKGVEFSALAGALGLPRCYSLDFNDGFTPVPSQLWTITDTARMNILYDAMAGGAVFGEFVLPRVAKGPGVRPRGIKLEGSKSGSP